MNITDVKTTAAKNMIARKRIVEICKSLGFNINIVIGSSRFKPDVAMRKKVATIMHEEGFSSVTIGKVLNRDHASILSYFREK